MFIIMVTGTPPAIHSLAGLWCCVPTTCNRAAFAYEQRCGVTQRVAVVGIEVGGVGATAFIPEEVVLGSELAVVFAFGFHLGQAASYHLAQQFLGLDERYLYVSVGSRSSVS